MKAKPTREKEIPKNTFGYLLRQARKKAGYTQAELADKAFLARMYIHKLEMSYHIPNLDTICKLCVALNVTPDYLLVEDVKRWKELFALANKKGA